ncbi:N-6 DNA methylase [Candidatus Dojkabacteria bacterium]|nr:N-6 DNA methylase [Candidatus Dojkabacteria bacterium]
MVTKEIFKRKLQNLVERFQKFEIENKRSIYNETLARRDFIDPFFEALGWDIDNRKGLSFDSREVIHEDQLKIQGKFKAPDYCFRIDGRRKFFVEAKKPSIDIKRGFSESLQLRRYGWNGETSLSILTDFEELAIYDTRIKPKLSDTSKIARIEYIKYTEYLDKWEHIYDIFSKEAVEGGKFDEFIGKPIKGVLSVDKDFLETISNWRNWLAKDIATNNKKITIENLNLTVQKLIDRIIFLRIAEDRGLEEYGNLQNLIKYKDSYKRLVEHFVVANKKYDSNLFEFESGLTPNLKISDKILDKILDDLYYPTSPYEFSVIGVELLGKIYEQFLGKVIRLTSSHNAVVEEKPEVRKAGGVYYTPKYIVEYIVKNTVGELVKGKTPKQIEKIKIVDPACGSGSFLIGAYDYLLDYHLNYYMKSNPSQYKKEVFKDSLGNWLLTTLEKRKILLNNIYGVDIDRQAVEVTKLSLSLKMLENENRETINQQLKIFAERILPDLEGNIKCGNSLIGSDYWDDKDLSKVTEEEIRKVNSFDWKKEFSEVFKQGGFDGVIGNPPYIKIQGLQEFAPEQVSYLKSTYESASKGNIDIYVMFLEKSLKLLNKTGLSGFILPHKFFQADFGSMVRRIISTGKSVRKVLSFREKQVFTNATTYTCLLFLSGRQNKVFNYSQIRENQDPEGYLKNVKFNKLTSDQLDHDKWNLTNLETKSVLDKLNRNTITLGDITEKIFVGLQTSADKIYVLEILGEDTDNYRLFSKSLGREEILEKGLCKKFLMGKEVHRYQPLTAKNVVIFPYKLNKNEPELMPLDYIRLNFPKGYEYILRNKEELERREKSKFKDSWWCFGRPQNLHDFDKEKIVMPDISVKPELTYDESNLYHTTTVYSVLFKEIKEDPIYVLGVLNSSLFWFFIKNTGTVLRGDYIRFKTNYLKPFPIRLINFHNNEEKTTHNDIVKMVRQILSLKKELISNMSNLQKKLSEKRIDNLEMKINQDVYKLYKLTETEIGIIEKSL